MAGEQISTNRQMAGPKSPSIIELIDRLSRFDGPPDQFLVNLLAVQCQIAGATGGAILRIGQTGKPEVIAVFPHFEQGQTAPVWLAQSVEAAPAVMAGGKPETKQVHTPESLYGQPTKENLVLLPMLGGAGVRGVAAFLVTSGNARELAARRERLELTTSLLSMYEMRLTLQRRQLDLQRISLAMHVLSAVNEQDKITGSAMALCNEVASRWQADRVSLGFLKGRYVKIKATSNTEKFNRKMKLIQDIESVMEECLDQDIEIIFPAPQDAACVSRAAAHLSSQQGANTVLSIPLRRDGHPVAVLTVERPLDSQFSLEEVEAMRLTCDLATARMVNLFKNDRWIGARAASGLRKGLAILVGPKHTWAKVASIAILAGILFVCLADGTYKAEAPFVIQATTQQVIPAPFDGRLESVEVEPGDEVIAGKTVLATLDTSELRLQLISRQSEWQKFRTEANIAMRDSKTAEEQIARANASEIDAEIELIQHRIDQAKILSPIDGTVVTGDLKRQVGGPVQIGTTLFEVAPLDSLLAELAVPEDQILDVEEGFEGELATVRDPANKISFRVERINPVAEVVNRRNVYKVRVLLLDSYPGLTPGAEGIAKVTLGKRKYAWLWTRKLVNWIKMKLWI